MGAAIVGSVLTLLLPVLWKDLQSSDPGPKLVAGEIGPFGAWSYLDASARGHQQRHFNWGEEVSIQGYCIGEATRAPETQEVLDERWYILKDRQVIPAWSVQRKLLSERQPSPCPGAGKKIGGAELIHLKPLKRHDGFVLHASVTKGATIAVAAFDRHSNGWRLLSLDHENGHGDNAYLSFGKATAALAVACWARAIPAHPKAAILANITMFKDFVRYSVPSVHTTARKGAEEACNREEYGRVSARASLRTQVKPAFHRKPVPNNRATTLPATAFKEYKESPKEPAVTHAKEHIANQLKPSNGGKEEGEEVGIYKPGK